MKCIHYASGSVVTGDEIADVLVRYAAALAANQTAAEVRAPALVGSGEPGEVTLLLGPASQMLVSDAEAEGPELRDPAFVEELERRVRMLGPLRAGFASATDQFEDFADFEDF